MPKSKRKKKRGDVLEFKISLNIISYVFLLATIFLFFKTFYIPRDFDGPPIIEQLRSVAWFFIAFWGIGATFTRYLKIEADFFESFFTKMGLGLGIFPILAIIFNFVGIPLSWQVFLIFGLAFPIYDLIRFIVGGIRSSNLDDRVNNIVKDFIKSFSSKETLHMLASVFFATVMFFVFVKGAFVYPWLEDSDSWEHATAAKYVSIFHTYSIPKDLFVAQYLEPYPSGYASLQGVTHQLNSLVSWSLKYFNSLIIALGVVFFYILVKKFSGNSVLAMYSTVFLAVSHHYSSHFIWAQALNVALFYPAFYALESIKENRNWFIIAFLILASQIVVQTITAVMFGIYFLTYFIITSLTEKRIQKMVFTAGIIGFLLALSFFWTPVFIKFGSEVVFKKILFGRGPEDVANFDLALRAVAGDATDRVYSLDEFIQAASPAHIPQPTGFGEVYFGLLLFSLLYLLTQPKKERYLIITLAWFFIAIAGIQSATLPISMGSTRNWTYLAIFSSIICGKGILAISKHTKKYPITSALFIGLIFVGVLFTTGVTKYEIETSVWPRGSFISEPQFQAYLNLKSITPNTPVLSACFHDYFVIGFDKLTFPWDKEVLDFKENTLPYLSVTELHKWLKRKGFNYIILDSGCFDKCSKKPDGSMCVMKWGELKAEMDKSELFSAPYRNEDAIIYYVK